MRCNTAGGWYLQGGACIQEILIPDRLGLNLLTGQVVSCASVGCLDCRSDYTRCGRCDSKAGWYLDAVTNQCVSAITLPSGMGPDRFTLVIKSCQESQCAECKADWKICSLCRSGAVPQNGRCTTTTSTQSTPGIAPTARPTSGRLSPGATRYYVDNSTAVFRFSAPVQLVYQGTFTDAFNLTLTDTLTDKSLTCEDPLVAEAELRCSVAVFGSVLIVRLTTDAELVVGRLSLSLVQQQVPEGSARSLSQRKLQSATTAAPEAGIVDSMTGAIFASYPLTVDGVSTQPDPYLYWAAQPLAQAKNVRPITSVLLAAVSVSLSVLLDKQLANLEYLAVLEGPVLVYPQQVFDLVAAASIFWPGELFGAPDWLTEVSRVSVCRPSTALERQGYRITQHIINP